MAFVVWQQRWRHQSRFNSIAWLLPMALVVSWYPLYAALKGELLPAGQSLSFFILNIVPSAGSHVSLVEALRWQAGRQGGGLGVNEQFLQTLRDQYLPQDAFLILGGTAAVVVNLIRGLRSRRALAAGLLG